MTRYAAAIGTIAWLAYGTAIAGAQSRFEATSQDAIAGIPGLRIVSVRDTVFGSCYLVFLAEPAGGRPPGEHEPLPDVARARSALDERLAGLLSAFEHEVGVLPGTIAPNPLGYQWQVATAQLEFMLVALEYQFARLEQHLDRMAEASRMTAMPAPCAPAKVRAAP